MKFKSKNLWLLTLLFLLPVARVQAACALPGKETATAISGVVNTYYPATASAAVGTTVITLGAASGSTTAISAQDLLLVIQMQDAAISQTTGINYGSGTGVGAGYLTLNNTGLYEYAVAANAVPLTGGTVTLTSPLTNSYDSAVTTATMGQRTFQVIRVPQYNSVTLTGPVSCTPWNGLSGGVVVMDVSYVLNLNNSVISASGLGFQGGGAKRLAGGAGCAAGENNYYEDSAAKAFFAYKGEGIAGLPALTYRLGMGNVVNTNNGGLDGYPGGDKARGAPGNAGGGGNDDNPCAANNQNAGGGGGGNGGVGGLGGNTWNGDTALGGLGGTVFPATSSRIVFGGGGGSGDRNDTDNINPAPGPYNDAGVIESSGGPGGGIVLIQTGYLFGGGTISADGSLGLDTENDGAGGGGGGGSVVVYSNDQFLYAGNVVLSASGANGGNAWIVEDGGESQRHGPGGGGGGGYVLTNASGSNIPSMFVTGGSNGFTNTVYDPYGATSGQAGQTLALASVLPGTNPGFSCAPTATITATPTATNSPTATTTPPTSTDTFTPSPTSTTIPCAIAYITANSKAVNMANANTTLNLTFNGTDTLLLVQVGIEGAAANDTVNLCTYNGAPLSQVLNAQDATNGGTVEVYCLVNPPNGTNTLAVSIAAPGATAMNVGAIVFQGVNTSTPIGAVTTALGAISATAQAVTLTTTASKSVISSLCLTDTNGVRVSGRGGNQNNRWNQAPAAAFGAEGDDTAPLGAPASNRLTFTLSAAAFADMAAVELLAGNCNPTSTPTRTPTTTPTPTNSPTITLTPIPGCVLSPNLDLKMRLINCANNIAVYRFYVKNNDPTTAVKLSDLTLKIFAYDTGAASWCFPSYFGGNVYDGTGAFQYTNATAIAGTAVAFNPNCTTIPNRYANWEMDVNCPNTQTIPANGGYWIDGNFALQICSTALFAPGFSSWYSQNPGWAGRGLFGCGG